jgi:hypothetical protein
MGCALHNINQTMKNLLAVVSTAPGLPAIWLTRDVSLAHLNAATLFY